MRNVDDTVQAMQMPAGAVAVRIFPQIMSAEPDSASGSSVRPSVEAVTCSYVEEPDEDWPVTRAHSRSSYVSSVALRLPARFAVRDNLDTGSDAELNGGILVGSWTDTADGVAANDQVRSMISVWIDPESGYPTVGMELTARQLRIQECISNVPVPGTRVVAFTVETPRGTQEYLGAVWPVAPQRYLRLLAIAPDSAQLTLLQSAFASVQHVKK